MVKLSLSLIGHSYFWSGLTLFFSSLILIYWRGKVQLWNGEIGIQYPYHRIGSFLFILSLIMFVIVIFVTIIYLKHQLSRSEKH